MRIIKDDLHTLIRSLTENEKAFLRKYAALQTNDAKYLKMFNYIATLDVYDEKKVKKQFENEPFNKQLSVAKNYLNDVILRTFRTTSIENSQQNQLKAAIQDIYFLIGKNCSRQALKEIKRTKKTAYEQEDFFVVAEIIHIERIMHGSLLSGYNKRFREDGLLKEEASVLEKLQNTNLLFDLYCRAKQITSSASDFSEGSRALLDLAKIHAHPILALEKNAITLKAKLWFWEIKMNYAQITGDTDQTYKYALQNLHLFEHNTKFAKHFAFSRAILLNTFLESLRPFQKLQLFKKYLQQLQEVHVANPYFKQRLAVYLADKSMFYYFRKGEEKQAIKYATDEFKRLQKNNTDRLDFIMHNYLMIAVIAIRFRQFQLANDAVSILITFPKSGVREHIIDTAKLLHAILHLFEQNYSITLNVFRSIERNPVKYPLHNLAVKYYKHFIIVNGNKKALRSIQKKYLLELYKLKQTELVELRETIYLFEYLWKIQV